MKNPFYPGELIAEKRKDILVELRDFATVNHISLVAAIEIHKLAIPEGNKLWEMRKQVRKLEQQLKDDGIDVSNI